MVIPRSCDGRRRKNPCEKRIVLNCFPQKKAQSLRESALFFCDNLREIKNVAQAAFAKSAKHTFRRGKFKRLHLDTKIIMQVFLAAPRHGE